MTGRNLTAREIARTLGISQPTVSRALSTTQAHLVAPETRERIMEAAKRLGYRPNAVARSLRQRRTNIMGFYSGYGYLNPADDFLAAIIGGLQRACDLHRMDLLLHGIYRGLSTDDIYAELVDGKIDGLFLLTWPEDPLAARFAQSNLPVVAVADLVPNLPSVTVDDAEGMRQTLLYLQEKGHRSVVFLAPSNTNMASVEERRQTYEAWMTAQGRPAYVVRAHIEDHAGALDAILALPERPTAIACWNDLTAYGILHQCRIRGIRVPDDLAVTGFDGFLDQKMPVLQLTTVIAPWGDVADTACQMLLDRLQGKEVSMVQHLPIRLLPGDTA